MGGYMMCIVNFVRTFYETVIIEWPLCPPCAPMGGARFEIAIAVDSSNPFPYYRNRFIVEESLHPALDPKSRLGAGRVSLLEMKSGEKDL